MAFTPVITVATGDLWTAANQNQYLRDNMAAMVPDLFTAAGDLGVGTAADAMKRLALGTALQHLRVNAGATDVEWFGKGDYITAEAGADRVVESGKVARASHVNLAIITDTVTFASAFSASPDVAVALDTDRNASGATMSIWIYSISTTQVVVKRWQNTAVTINSGFHWWAIGAKA